MPARNLDLHAALRQRRASTTAITMRHPIPFLPSVALLLALTLSHALASGAQPSLPRSTPESQGVSAAALLDTVDTLDRRVEGMHSLMVLRHGRVVAEGWWSPYSAAAKHELYSLSKSFTSTAVGFAAAEGRVSVDDPVLKFFPGEAPAEPSGNLKAMRVRDLLTMSAGHQDESPVWAHEISTAKFLAQPVPHKPGTHFKYNTPATFMLSAIVQKQTGSGLLDFLTPRLFEPLGITGATWDTNTQGYALGGYGLRVRTEDIAKLGQLYLQKGRWNGRQLLPAAWVQTASSKQVSNGSNPDSDWDQGYGFQFWRCRHNGFRGDGAFGQYCIVLPDQDAVVAITAGVRDMQAVLNILWEHLLPSFDKNRSSGGSEARKALQSRLAGLHLPYAEGSASSPQQASITGRTYRFAANDQKIESIRLERRSSGSGLDLILTLAGSETRIPCGYQEWLQGRGRFGTYASEPIAASGAWISEDTYRVRWAATETPYLQTLALQFKGEEVTVKSSINVAFGPTDRPALTGRAN